MDDTEELRKRFRAKTASKKIQLNLSASLARRQQYTEEQKKRTDLETQITNSVETSSGQAPVEEFRTPAVTEEIKLVHPGRCTFEPSCTFWLFSEDDLKIKDFRPENAKTMLFDLSDSEIHNYISRGLLKRPYLCDDIVDAVCLYLFYLASVHSDKRTANYCVTTIITIRKSWSPPVDSIFLVLCNWGLKSEFPDILNINAALRPMIQNLDTRQKCEGRELEYNIKKFLEIINCTAAEIAATAEEEKLDQLIHVLILAALQPGVPMFMYSNCIGNLLHHIPQLLWDENRVLRLAELIYAEGAENGFNQMAVCVSLLIVEPRSVELARCLACLTLNNILSRERNIPPVEVSACQDLIQLLSHYGQLFDMKVSDLYLVVKLVDLCVHADFSRERLSWEQLNFFEVWLKVLGTNNWAIESVDCNRLKELICRAQTAWDFIKVSVRDEEYRSLCNMNMSDLHIHFDLQNSDCEMELASPGTAVT